MEAVSVETSRPRPPELKLNPAVADSGDSSVHFPPSCAQASCGHVFSSFKCPQRVPAAPLELAHTPGFPAAAITRSAGAASLFCSSIFAAARRGSFLVFSVLLHAFFFSKYIFILF